MDNRELMKRLNKAIGRKHIAVIEDLSDAEIQIRGFDACKDVEEDPSPSGDYNAAGIPRLLAMMIDQNVTQETRGTIRSYFAREGDPHRKKKICRYIRDLLRTYRHAQELKDLQMQLTAE